MPENEGQERTEQATPRKLQKAREKGEVGKSRDLTSAVGLMGIVFFFFLFGERMMVQSEKIYAHYLGNCGTLPVTAAQVPVLGREAMGSLLFIILPPAAVAMFAALLTHMIQVGFLFSAEPISPKFEKIDPINGFKRLFSLQALAETVKGVLKIVVLGFIMKWIIVGRVRQMADIPFLPLMDVVRVTFDLLWAVVLAGALSYLVFGIADFGFQKWDFLRKQKMSRHELKEEHKEQEGDPYIRARVRSIQREMARKRMMAEVPKATVVLTNPTHIAVALRYSSDMGAPRIVAKGQGYIAEKIKQLAREHQVPVLENKPLARALNKLNLGDEIPEELYRAVAEVLAYVFRRNGNAYGPVPPAPAPARVDTGLG